MDLFEYQGKQYSPATASRLARRGRRHRRRGRRGRRRGSATRSSSRPRCRSAAAARPAASSWPTTPDEVREHAGKILGMDIKGHVVDARAGRAGRPTSPRSTTRSITLDRGREAAPGHGLGRGRRRDRGGRRGRPRRHRRGCTSTRSVGLRDYQRPRAGSSGRPRRRGRERRRRDPARSCTSCYVGGDATLVEINPLVLTRRRPGHRPRRQGHARRQRACTATPTCEELRDDVRESTRREQAAKEQGLQYVKLDGDVGIIGNGAGLVMSTLDMVNQAGGKRGQLPGHRRRRQRRGHGRPRSRSINSDPKVERCSSTSSAASPAATWWPTGSWRRSTASTLKVADGGAAGRHQRRGGPGDPRRARPSDRLVPAADHVDAARKAVELGASREAGAERWASSSTRTPGWSCRA